MKRIAVLAAMLAILLVVFGLSDRAAFHAPPAEAAETTTDFFYGNNGDGTIGPVGPLQANEQLLGLSIPPPCTGCYLVRIEPDLVYWNDSNPLLTNGMSANYNTSNSEGIWLHHDGLVDGCFKTLFLSGNERTVYQSPTGYGSYLGVPGSPDDPNFCNSSWFVTWHIHNSSPTATHNVKLKLRVTYRTGETLIKLKGVGLNVATAQDAEYTIPTNYSDTHTCPSNCGTGIATDHVVTAAEQGQIIAGGGHVHDYGFGVSAFNVTRNQWICTSPAGYGAGSRYLPTGGPGTPGHPAAANAQTLNHAYHLPATPDDAYHIQNMSLCSISPRGSILCTGDVIRVHASYNNQSGFPITDAMGILSLALPMTPPDADGDGTWDGCDAGNSDNDLGGFADQVEFMAGTLSNTACGVNAWPPDLNNDTFVDIVGDISTIASNFAQAAPPAPLRQDIAPSPPDGFIDVTGDISRMAGLFGQHC